jgi:hypothetical protein
LSEADEAAAEREQGVVDVGAAFVADEQSFEVVQPGEGALDDPAVATEAGAVLGPAARDHGSDAALADEPAVLVVVVAAVCDQAVWVMSLRLPPVTEKAVPSQLDDGCRRRSSSGTGSLHAEMASKGGLPRHAQLIVDRLFRI